MSLDLEIRFAREDEFAALARVERDAAERFRGLDLMRETLLEKTLPCSMLDKARRAGAPLGGRAAGWGAPRLRPRASDRSRAASQ